MRLLKLSVYYPVYLKNFYNRQPTLKLHSYCFQLKTLIWDCFGASDFWSSALNTLGYDSIDIIANAEFLQKSWASENDLNFDEKNWLYEIAESQIKKFRPDILFITDYITFTAEFIRTIRRECPTIKLILGWCGAGYYDSSVFREWDIALSCIPEMVADFNKKGIRSCHVNHAFAPRILNELKSESQPDIDFAFIGSVVKQNKFHTERERLLKYLVKSTNLQIWSDLARPSRKQRYNIAIRQKAFEAITAARNAGVPEKVLEALPLVKKAVRWKSSPNLNQFIDERILRRAHPPLFGIEMFQKLRNSRVVLNNHIDVSPASASNMRLFEATGVGACLLTDWKENLTDFFEPEKEVVTYRTAAECAEKINYLLSHEDERQAIAKAGQLRTLCDHTFENRAARIDEIIQDFSNSKN